MNMTADIRQPDRAKYDEAKERWDSIAKPLGSFGKLEDIVCRIAAIQGTADVDISSRAVVVMCGDHGVVAEGVTQCGSEVTAECAKDIAGGRASVNAVAETVGARVVTVDVGIASDVECEGLINKKVAYGTGDMVHGPAMSSAQTKKALAVGIDIAGRLAAEGVKIIVAGEMGIGNTTAASAVSSVLLGLPPEQVTGRGAGLSDKGLRRKAAVIRQAIEINRPDPNDAFSVLQKLGGLEIAAMAGLFIGGALFRMPVIVDGIISAAAAAAAVKYTPDCAAFILASHRSGEPAADALLSLTGAEPVIDAGLRLGEGTGGLLLLPLIDAALGIYRNARRFEDTNIERYVELS